jgi:DNA-directed RNA polymerase subunit RPC12/RpoP
MKELLRIDPQADKSSHIRYRRQGRDGEPDGPVKNVGEDRRLSAERVRKAYQQLGSFLHVPTIKQSREDEPLDVNVARDRAETIRAELEHVLSTTISNANFGQFITFNCSQCETPVKRRTSIIEEGSEVECGNCGQTFTLEPDADGSFSVVTLSYSWDCNVCGTLREIPRSKAKDGLDVTCPNCNDRVTLSREERWVLVSAQEQQAEESGTSD